MAQLMNTCSNSIYSIKPNRFVILAYLGEPHHRIWGCADIKAGGKKKKSSAWPVCAVPGGAGPTHTFFTSDTGVEKLWKIFWNWPEHHAMKKLDEGKKTWKQNKASNRRSVSRHCGILSAFFLSDVFICIGKRNKLLVNVIGRQYYTGGSPKHHKIKKKPHKPTNMQENWVKWIWPKYRMRVNAAMVKLIVAERKR